MSSTGRILRAEGSWKLSSSWYMSSYNFSPLFFPSITNVSTLLPQYFSALPTTGYTQEQELQMFTETQGKALKNRKGVEVVLVLLSQLLPGEVGIPLPPCTALLSNLCLKCHRSGRPGFEPPSQILLPDTQHRPKVCGYYRLNTSDTQLRVA